VCGIDTRRWTYRRCRSDQSPHDVCVSANNDPALASSDDHSTRLSVGRIEEPSARADLDEGVSLVANTDLSTEFEKISERAKAATSNLRAASQRTRDQLAADAASARNRATVAADQLKDNVSGAHDKVSSQWQEIRGKWQAHVAKARSSLQEKKEQFDAEAAEADASFALSYAVDAIDFAQAAVDEAESAALDAMYARASADALKTGQATGV